MDSFDPVHVSSSGSGSETRECHDCGANVEPSDLDGPLHGSDQRLIDLDVFNLKKLRRVELGVITFDEWGCGQFGAVSKDAFEVVQGFVDVLAWGITQSTVFVSEEVTSKVELDGSGSFQFELVVVDEGISQESCVLANDT